MESNATCKSGIQPTIIALQSPPVCTMEPLALSLFTTSRKKYTFANKKSFDPVYAIMNDLAEKGDKNKEIFLVGNKLDRAEEFGEREVRK